MINSKTSTAIGECIPPSTPNRREVYLFTIVLNVYRECRYQLQARTHPSNMVPSAVRESNVWLVCYCWSFPVFRASWSRCTHLPNFIQMFVRVSNIKRLGKSSVSVQCAITGPCLRMHHRPSA